MQHLLPRIPSRTALLQPFKRQSQTPSQGHPSTLSWPPALILHDAPSLSRDPPILPFYHLLEGLLVRHRGPYPCTHAHNTLHTHVHTYTQTATHTTKPSFWRSKDQFCNRLLCMVGFRLYPDKSPLSTFTFDNILLKLCSLGTAPSTGLVGTKQKRHPGRLQPWDRHTPRASLGSEKCHGDRQVPAHGGPVQSPIGSTQHGTWDPVSPHPALDCHTASSTAL